ncbi:CDP-diacylglycerol--glycerol-3-phosphate 3-phosphatidyltransferase [Eubacteriales bacterium OttesenSCG-928-N13]|nr:CDP-diacylglycerol--glycerol-3-phosphate 3-phosphatidyltransferase [Eubacteriales bacterium OttesenSCG-928-N13]
MNLPNALTILRILMIPLFVWTYYCVSPVVAIVVYLLASITDFFDGYLARKWNQITNFGKLADPLADKLMTITLLVCLADTDYVAWWLVIVMIAKELLMMIGALLMLRRKVVVYANMYGKVATVLFIVAIVLVFPWHPVNVMSTIGNILIYVALGLSLLSMAIYAKGAYRQLCDTKPNT